MKVLEYSRYDINGYHFRAAILEVSHPLAATTNSRLVISGKDATSHVTDYYDILQNSVEYTFDGAKALKVVFFQCDCFDQSTTPKWMILVWLRSSMNHAIHA